MVLVNINLEAAVEDITAVAAAVTVAVMEPVEVAEAATHIQHYVILWFILKESKLVMAK